MAVGIGSCKSSKELTYLQNLPAGSIQTKPEFSTEDYRLRESDNLYVQVISINPEVSQLFNPTGGSGNTSGTTQQYGTESAQYINGYQVDNSGFIELPVAGKVYVLNKTLIEARELIYQQIKLYFKEVTVYVKLLSFKYTLLGEITKPGVYYSFRNSCTILDAISQASGTTDYAKLRNVVVLRERENQKQSIKIDLTDQSLLNSEAYYLQPNDVVYVSPDGRFKNTKLNASVYSLMLSTVTTLIVILKFID